MILDRLENAPGTKLFAPVVRRQPYLMQPLNPESGHTTPAPNNVAVERVEEVDIVVIFVALSFVERGPKDLSLTAGPKAVKAALDESGHVDAKKGEPARLAHW